MKQFQIMVSTKAKTLAKDTGQYPLIIDGGGTISNSIRN